METANTALETGIKTNQILDKSNDRVMEITNHQNETFILTGFEYMNTDITDSYFDDNWLKAEIEFSGKQQEQRIELETLQVEELIHLLGWLEQLIVNRKGTRPFFDFLDSNIEFQVLKDINIDMLRFIYYSEQKETCHWDMKLNDQNLNDFKQQLQQILIKYPIR